MRSSIVVRGSRWQLALCLSGCLWGVACGSGGGKAPEQSTDTDTSTAGDETPDDSPGNLPNLSTHSNDPPEETEPEEPADCAVQTLSSCVTAALTELSDCLAASHGGTFSQDAASCALSEGDASVTFAQPVSRWSTAFLLQFSIDVAGSRCASYTERADSGSIPSGIDLVTAQHIVGFELAADGQSTLTCDGVAVSYRASNLSSCREAKNAPSPELMDQTASGVYSVSPKQQSDRRIFNCSFPPAAP